MSDALFFVIFAGAWFGLQYWLLPKLGVST